MSSILRGNNLSFIMVNLVATKVEITKASRQKFMVIGKYINVAIERELMLYMSRTLSLLNNGAVFAG